MVKNSLCHALNIVFLKQQVLSCLIPYIHVVGYSKRMAAPDSLAVLQSGVLVAPVTALEFLGDDCLLTGELHAGLDQVCNKHAMASLYNKVMSA